MLHRLLTAALLAGLGAGLLSFAAQSVAVMPLIQQAESYEHATAKQPPSAGQQGHEHAHVAAANGTMRLLLTLGGDLATGVGFALLLCAAITLRGSPVTIFGGFCWGLAGFAVFSGLPALGLPPLPPGVEAAPVAARQLWWVMTVGCSGAGLALAIFAPGRALRLAGAVFLLLPHVIGAPQAPLLAVPAVPAGLTGLFAAASLGVAALFWAVLGALCGLFLRRGLAVEPARPPG